MITWGWGIESGGREALIDEIYVALSHRGLGLASALVEVSLEKAKTMNTKVVFLETESDNPQSRELYERLGFKAESSVWMRALLETDD